MKRKELHDYIREEIINELTTVTKNTETSEIPTISKAENTPPTTVANAIKQAKSSGKDVNIAEMARPSTIIKIGDQAKVDRNKTRYDLNTLRGKIIDAVEKAGDQGISFNDIENSIPELGKNPKSYMEIKSLVDMGLFDPVITSKAEPKPTEKPTPEPTPSAAPSGDEDEWEAAAEKDDWEKAEDEDEEADKGPSASDIKAAEKSAAKATGGKGYAKQLSPEDEEKYTRLRTGIEAKISKILALPKTKRSSSTDLQVLKTLIKRDDVKKLFKAKGVNLNDLVSDVMN
jgi:hypothetical protein